MSKPNGQFSKTTLNLTTRQIGWNTKFRRAKTIKSIKSNHESPCFVLRTRSISETYTIHDPTGRRITQDPRGTYFCRERTEIRRHSRRPMTFQVRSDAAAAGVYHVVGPVSRANASLPFVPHIQQCREKRRGNAVFVVWRIGGNRNDVNKSKRSATNKHTFTTTDNSATGRRTGRRRARYAAAAAAAAAAFARDGSSGW